MLKGEVGKPERDAEKVKHRGSCRTGVKMRVKVEGKIVVSLDIMFR